VVYWVVSGEESCKKYVLGKPDEIGSRLEHT